LEEVRVDCPDADSVFLPKLYDLGRGLTRAKIPEHMNRDRRTKTGKRVDLSGVGQLVIDIDRSGILEELAEAGAGVGKAPTRGLDSELIERLLNSLGLGFVHKRRVKVFVTARNRRNGISICLHIILKICLDILKTGVMILIGEQPIFVVLKS
jgi:hypothetical protein